MEAVRPGIAMSAVAAVTLGSAIAIAPPLVGKNPIPVPTTASSQEVLLAGFIADIYNQIQPVVAAAVDSATAVIGTIPVVGPPIADQIDILYTYGQQAVGGTVYWVDDLVTPLATGQFWPLSGQPGTYLTGAINSTVNWGQGLINTAIGFVRSPRFRHDQPPLHGSLRCARRRQERQPPRLPPPAPLKQPRPPSARPGVPHGLPPRHVRRPSM